MNAIDKLALMADLVNEHCGLSHGPGARREDYPACDYLVIPFGSQREPDASEAGREMVIPVCHECADALSHDEWTLLYCFECNNSRWVCRELAKNRYRHNVLWLRGCPDCSNQFGGLYFSDGEEQEREAVLTGSNVSLLAA